MGIFSELDIDQKAREGKPPELALMLSDESRPAQLWQIKAAAGGFALIESPKNPGFYRLEPERELWVIA